VLVHRAEDGDEWPDPSLHADGSLVPKGGNLGPGPRTADPELFYTRPMAAASDDDGDDGGDGGFGMQGLADELPPGRPAACTPLLGLAALPADLGGDAGGAGGGNVKRAAPATTPRGEGGALEQTPRGVKKKQPRPADDGESQAADAGEGGDEGSVGAADEVMAADEPQEESEGVDGDDEDYVCESEGEGEE
jgi:hypothetical protein